MVVVFGQLEISFRVTVSALNRVAPGNPIIARSALEGYPDLVLPDRFGDPRRSTVSKINA